MDRLDYRVRRGRQGAVDQVRAGDRFGLCTALAPEFGPDPTEREQRTVLVEREPNDVLLFCFRVRLRRVAAFRFQPRLPVR